ncbi:MAG: PilN domain-containing protein [Pirellulaceae bacterium]
MKVARSSDSWQVVSSGEMPWHSLERSPDQNKEELETLLKKLATREGVSREPIHVSLHSRYCVTRVVTGNKEQVQKQLDEIIANSHHYLQFGLGEKLIGQSSTNISESNQYGQVAIIKRGLIESVEKAINFSSLELQSVDGAIPSASRLIGISGLDYETPLLVVWSTGACAEIGISYQGRLQLSYHVADGADVENVAGTISKHMKRLKRFCSRYRSVDGDGELNRALVLADNATSQGLRDRLIDAFEHVYTREDLAESQIKQHLNDAQQLSSPGVVSALGGLLVHLDSDVLPATDIFDNYLASKPRPLFDIIFRDGWMVMAAAAVLLMIVSYSAWIEHRIHVVQDAISLLSIDFASEREQVIALDESRRELREYQRLSEFSQQISERALLRLVAGCLPEDTRIDSLSIDSMDKIILKGVMLQGDRTYEVLTALRDSPLIGEVALESVGKTASFNVSATMFEIHCQLVRKSPKSVERVARVVPTQGRRQ